MIKNKNARIVLYIFAYILSIVLLLSPIRTYASEYEYEDNDDIIIVFSINRSVSK